MKRYIQIAFGTFFGAALLWLVFRGTDWHEVWQAIRAMHKGWFLLALLPLGASFFLRVKRWSYVVRTAEDVSYRKLFNATQIGFFVNFTIGARLGEPARAYVLKRATSLSFAQSFAMAALDRVLDLIGLMPVMLVAVFAFTSPGDILIPAELMPTGQDFTVPANIVSSGAKGSVLFLMLVIGCMALLYIKKGLMVRIADRVCSPISSKLATFATHTLEQLAEGMHVFRSLRDLFWANAYNLLVWTSFLLSAFSFIKAFGLDIPWYTPFLLQALMAVAISTPGPPGALGQYHIPIVVSLIMINPAFDANVLKALAIVMHLANIAFVYALGIFSLIDEGLGVRKLGHELAAADDADEGDKA